MAIGIKKRFTLRRSTSYPKGTNTSVYGQYTNNEHHIKVKHTALSPHQNGQRAINRQCTDNRHTVHRQHAHSTLYGQQTTSSPCSSPPRSLESSGLLASSTRCLQAQPVSEVSRGEAKLVNTNIVMNSCERKYRLPLLTSRLPIAESKM